MNCSSTVGDIVNEGMHFFFEHESTRAGENVLEGQTGRNGGDLGRATPEVRNAGGNYVPAGSGSGNCCCLNESQ